MNPRQNAPQPTDPLSQLNDPGEVFRAPAQIEFVRTLVRLLKTAFGRVVFKDQAAPSFILISPSGKSYTVSVADDGSLVTAYVRG